MKKLFTIVAALLAVAVVSAESVQTVIIPRPMEATSVKGACTISAKSVVAVTEAELVRPAELFAAYVATDLGATLAVEQKAKGDIVLSLDKSLAKEEYTLTISSKGVQIVGDQPLSVSVWNTTQDALNSAKHIGEAPVLEDSFVLNVDLVQNGVGGTDTWSSKARPYDKYRLLEKEYSYGFWIVPVK